ncbi:MAG: ribose 5-phosphate isomerase B [Brevefilum sp.]|nr:ribose 5-phosphate isomerase B [Brevefilum sp.]
MRTTLSEEQIREIVRNTVYETLGVPSPENQTSPLAKNAQTQDEPLKKPLERQRVAIGTDHGGVDLKSILKQDLISLGYEVIDVGTHTKDAVDYPDIAREVAELVATGQAWRGVVIDGAGIGSCMAANKVPGVRAAMCYDYATAVNSREHNNANVLTLGAGMLEVNLAQRILKTWLGTAFGGGRHTRRVDKITAIEKSYAKDGK